MHSNVDLWTHFIFAFFSRFDKYVLWLFFSRFGCPSMCIRESPMIITNKLFFSLFFLCFLFRHFILFLFKPFQFGLSLPCEFFELQAICIKNFFRFFFLLHNFRCCWCFFSCLCIILIFLLWFISSVNMWPGHFVFCVYVWTEFGKKGR